MARLMLAMVGCLTFGAGGMWVMSNFKLKFEPVDAPDQPPQTAQAPTAPAEPAKLPPSVLAMAHPPQSPAGAGVVQAGGSLPVAFGTAAVGVGQPAVPPKTPEAIIRIEDGHGLVWKNPGVGVVRLAGDTPTFVFSRGPEIDVNVEIDGTEQKVRVTDDGTVHKLSLNLATATPTGTPFTVRVSRTDKSNANNTVTRVSTVTLVRPSSNQPLVFSVDAASNTESVAPTALAATDVYGSYLRLKGRTLKLLSRPKFYFVFGGETLEITRAEAVPGTPNDWDYALHLPPFAVGQSGQVVVRGDFAAEHVFATTEVTVTFRAPPGAVPAPAVELGESAATFAELPKAVEADQVGGMTTYLYNRRAIKVRVTPVAGVRAVSVYLDSENRLIETRAVSDASAQVFDIPDVGGGRDHVVTAVARIGEATSPPVQLALRVVPTGPRVDAVLAAGFGSSGGIGSEKLRIRFAGTDNKLNVGTLASAFKVLHNEATASDIPTNLSPGTPEYDATTNTVTLTATPIKPGSYLVRVTTAVRDIYGNAIVVAPGVTKSDSAFETTLFTNTVDAPQPSVAAGVTSTGKNPEFPDYTKFREFPDGANPSDRVESRVVRLYYARDAHRVAQIINRDVRSYNGPAVDVRRRAADRVRDQADGLQLERQRQERAAVNAAVRTRRAESELKQAEARLQSARAEGATATLQASQRQAQLEQALRSLGRDQTGIDVRARTDASADAAQIRVTQLRGDVLRTEQAVTDAGLAQGSSIPFADQKLLDARNDLSAKQSALATAFANARVAVADDAAVKTAKQQRDDIAQQMANPNTAAADRFALQASLNVAQQRMNEAEQAAILRSPGAETIQAATAAVQTSQLAVEKQRAGREALANLPALNLSLADAERDLERARAVAGGRAVTDTGADLSQDSAAALREELRKLQLVQSSAATTEQNARADVERLRGEVQGLRAEELRLTEAALGKEGEERFKRVEQFRREVAAALADPDTYAAGQPESRDAVLQCSVSVIGEGLIHIRGPVKGLNIIRTMVNQIDAPSGQVRIGVHTVQVNGERVDRMNKVVENIQRYIDHSRFMTATSAQMLRNAVTTVASRKAVEAAGTLAPECTQADRDQKYLYAFFGKDFIDELKALDSEFLRTGNKLLSLHSMDSTSLASALFLMSLARNDVREEILTEFKCQLQVKLPQAEWEKFVSGLSCPSKCEACFDRTFCMLAQNATFPGFFGFFNTEVLGADTLTPIQREFVRLAQIFKARLVTEMELKQRVMERTLLEDRVGDFRNEQRKAKEQEDKAATELAKFRNSQARAAAEAQKAIAELEVTLNDIDEEIGGIVVAAQSVESLKNQGATYTGVKPSRLVQVQSKGKVVTLPQVNLEENEVWLGPDTKATLAKVGGFLKQFVYLNEANREHFDKVLFLLTKAVAEETIKLTQDEYTKLREGTSKILILVRAQSATARNSLAEIERAMRGRSPDAFELVGRYNAMRNDIAQKLQAGTPLADRVLGVFRTQSDPAFLAFGKAATDLAAARQIAQLSRRPLDEKKLLDMLVDDMEEKLIELLDGTRAHTANVDNYLKALATALDDDFNTQFYQPAFKKVRSLAGGRDVYLGQIESTSVLTNNRVLGKVSPTASMEFDLPRREILIKEAFKGAKAAVQEYGALLNDPVFLSMVKMYAGNPVGANAGGFGGLPAVRNVLPGLPGSADEMIMAQSGAKPPEFGTYLEGLIPDPSIYKFETGTGYEVRPVLSPDGQAVVFAFDYMYTTDVREPVRPDEKHLGRVKRHLLHTDVQLSNFELREVSKYWVTLKAARTGNGVALLQRIPVAGALFRPAPSAGSSLQQNLIYSQAALFPTLFDLMGLRYAQAVADLSPGGIIDTEFVTRGRNEYLRQYIFDYGASRVDDALRIMYGERRPDLYRNQWTIPAEHPNGYRGGGLRQWDATLQEGYDPAQSYPQEKFAPGLRLPQRFGHDPFAPTERPPGLPPLPPGAIVPGHTTGRLPDGGFGGRPSHSAVDLGTTITRQPVGPLPVGRPSPPLRAVPPVNVPSPTTAPKTPAQPSIISRSQAPLDPPTGPRVYPSDPVAMPRGQYFPR